MSERLTSAPATDEYRSNWHRLFGKIPPAGASPLAKEPGRAMPVVRPGTVFPMDVPCPDCGAAPGQMCNSLTTPKVIAPYLHDSRRKAAYQRRTNAPTV